MKSAKQRFEIEVEYRGDPKPFSKLLKMAVSVKSCTIIKEDAPIITKSKQKRSARSETTQSLSVIYQYIKGLLISAGYNFKKISEFDTSPPNSFTMFNKPRPWARESVGDIEIQCRDWESATAIVILIVSKDFKTLTYYGDKTYCWTIADPMMKKELLKVIKEHVLTPVEEDHEE